VLQFEIKIKKQSESRLRLLFLKNPCDGEKIPGDRVDVEILKPKVLIVLGESLFSKSPDKDLCQRVVIVT